MNRFFAPGGEFNLIERMFPPDRFSRDAKGLGDDAFFLEPANGTKWVVTADASAEGIHYRLDWVSPEKALRKALLANLSDINAMGGRSRHVFLNLGAGPDWNEPVFDALGHALRDLEEAENFRVSGGDTVRTADKSFFAFTVMGEVKGRPLLRSAAQPGHRIYVSGSLGASAAGLRILEGGKPATVTEKNRVQTHLNPKPPLNLGPMLASFDREIAAIDISDGLSSELWHLSRQSRARLQVDWNKLPVSGDLAGLNEEEIRDFVLNGGEEYQLLFTGNFSSAELDQMSKTGAIAEIGEVMQGEGVDLKENGQTLPLEAGGFSHRV